MSIQVKQELKEVIKASSEAKGTKGEKAKAKELAKENKEGKAITSVAAAVKALPELKPRSRHDSAGI